MKKIVEGAGGVVFNSEGLILLLGHRNGTWVFPKGHIDPGETHIVAAIREVEEEGGVVATCPDEKIVYTTRYKNARKEERVITWFLLETTASSVLLREATFPKGGFYTLPEALKKLTFDEDKKLLEYMTESRAEAGERANRTEKVQHSPH